MNASLTLAMLAAAGAALVIQNLLMVRITQSVSTIVITLVANSAVGLVLLVSTLLARNGVAGITEALGAARWWWLLPGLLGSYFVFAGIMGYQRVGAAATISVLVASQLLAGLAADALKAENPLSRLGLPSLLGAALLVAGAYLIVRDRV
ncbi:DMT family transporter [Niveibacterium sp.]|uniref:DMT family transporter n=1 Tax=Niveibacterium sp. TaxID=2017444 RepID=UPI0035B3B27B